MKEYKVVISDNARRMLGEHVRFLAEVSPSAAREAKDRLMSSIRSLKSMPERYPFLKDEYIHAKKYRKMFVEKYYLVLYKVEGNTVFVEHIVDCRQDYSWLL